MEARDGNGPIAGKVALITGSTGGLGLAFANGLAAHGCRIVLHGLENAVRAEAVRAALAERHGVECLFNGADLAEPDRIEGLAHEIERAFGGIDILVNNAVVRQFGPVETMPRAGWDRSIAVNLSAPFHLIHLALPGMKVRGFGRIVNVSSIYGLIGATNRADYVTTKTALIGLTRAVALETAEFDITCNAICPGTVPTEAITGRIRDIAASQGIGEDEATQEYLATRQPSRRFIAEDNVAAMVAFLCGPGGRDITGAALPIDGGWSIA